METKEIILPQGWEIEKIENGKIILKEGVKKLPKTWEEFCEAHLVTEQEYYVSERSSIIGCTRNEPRLVNEDRNILPDKHTAEALLALAQLIQLRNCYRQGWKPSLWDFSTDQWNIFNNRNEVCVNFSTTSGRILSFQTEEIAELFLKNFKDLIETAKDLI